jgi:hypothetical protein
MRRSGDAVDHRRLARLHPQRGAAVDGEVHGLEVAQGLHHLDRDAAFLLAAAGDVVHAAERQHLRSVFGGRDMAHHLALAAHVGLLGARASGRCRSSPSGCNS